MKKKKFPRFLLLRGKFHEEFKFHLQILLAEGPECCIPIMYFKKRSEALALVKQISQTPLDETKKGKVLSW